MQPTILITGANGQLGSELRQLEDQYPAFNFVFLSKADLPLNNFEMIRSSFKAYQPAFCINCAAYTAVDKAETERDLAFQVNAEAVGILAAVCSEQNCRFVHISTDYVFDGTATKPYTPADATNPQSVYGASKLAGEQQAMELNPDSIIIRTSWVYSAFGKNFVKTMLRLMAERTEIGVVNDQLGSPTYAADLAEAIMEVIASGKWYPGIYHFSNKGIISWYELAVAIRDSIGSNCKVNPIPTSAYPTPARRPAYSVMDSSLLAERYGITSQPWQERLKACLQQIEKAPH
ncbi:MAG: dTDP-4-dehydrorhamnose reductase [Chitinophagaceae bacterium]|nr:dTDP-4-dehydrorhamnose reductase [Chitinophagaceae bacterium]